MTWSSIAARAEQAARACAIALGFTIPISVALDNVLLGLMLIFWLASLGRGRLAAIVRNPVVLAALALFGMLAAGLAWGTRDPGDGLRYLGKYLDLVLIPVFITLFGAAHARRRALLAFAAAMAVTLLLSYLMWAGVLRPGEPFVSDQIDGSVFKKSLTHNLLMAFATFVFFQLGRSAATARQRCAWYALALLAAVNTVLIGSGKTGHVVLLALLVYLACAWLKPKTAVVAAAGITLLAIALALGTSNPFSRAIDDWQAWKPDEIPTTSTGERIGFYRNSLAIALAHPLVGTGTGSFPKVYADHVRGSVVPPTSNPHSEYLNLAVQLGAVGVALLLGLFCCVWRYAAVLPHAHETQLARGLVITFATGCLFNSLLMDHVEGLLFAWCCGVLFAALRAPKEGQR